MRGMRKDRVTFAAGLVTAMAMAAGVGWMLAETGGEQPGDLASAPTVESTGGLGSAPPEPGQTGPPDPTSDPTAGGGDAGGQPGGSGTGGQPGSSGGSGSGGSGTGGGSGESGTGGAATGPQIALFQVTQEPRCPGGTTQFPIEGQPVGLQWRVTGVDEVTISIDGPGVFATYPAEGSDSYSFACTGSEGDLEQHTYLLTATSDGTTVTETLVVTAEVHERVNVP